MSIGEFKAKEMFFYLIIERNNFPFLTKHKDLKVLVLKR